MSARVLENSRCDPVATPRSCCAVRAVGLLIEPIRVASRLRQITRSRIGGFLLERPDGGGHCRAVCAEAVNPICNSPLAAAGRR